jgi:hypothetical protein
MSDDKARIAVLEKMVDASTGMTSTRYWKIVES